MDEARLGRLISTHPVDCRGRWASGVTGVLFVMFGAAVLAYMFVVPDIMDRRQGGIEYSSSPGGWLFALAAGVIVIGLPLAVVQLPRAIRGGWREIFDVHSRGIVHRGWRVRSWTWKEVAAIRPKAERSDEEGSVWNLLQFTIQFTDGTRVHLDRHAADASLIVKTVKARCPEVGEIPPSVGSRLKTFLPPYLVAFFACALAAMFWFLYKVDEGKSLVGDGHAGPIIEELSERAEMLLIMGTLVSFFGLLFSLIWLMWRPPRHKR
jgi:hypothetical protein